MAKKIGILVADLYQDLEVWYPLLRLREAGIEVTIIGVEKNKVYKSKHGYEITSDTSAKEVKAETLDGLIIPGGYAPDIMRRYPEMVTLVKSIYEQGKVVAAICHGGWMLASAKILSDKTVTSFFAIKDDLEHAGARFVDAEVVVDGNLITSRKPEDLPMFVKEIIKALQD